VLGASERSAAAVAAWRAHGLSVDTPDGADLFTALGLLSSAVAERPAGAPLQALATRLLAARYAVFVGAPARLPVHGALLIEAVHRIVGVLNRTTRAAALWIGGGDGAATANQVFTWLSGLPLRTRAGARGLEHEPLLHGTTRLLANGGADLLLWVSAFDANARPPVADVPLIALAHPAQAAAVARAGAVCMAVSTPGIGSSGHLFRSDGTVLMPLAAARPDTLPTVAEAVALIRNGGGGR
jgi:formylmethanofuran dehydrogenase subunit B